MISSELIQAAIVAKLKANTTLVNWLTALGATSEIREVDWQGSSFVYPNVRVQIGTEVPDGNLGVCQTTRSEIPFTIYSFSESNSSRQADTLAGLVNAAIFGQYFNGTGWRSMIVNSDGIIKAIRTGQRVWQATGLYRAKLYET